MVVREVCPTEGNLTVAVTSFVGRRREIAQVQRCLAVSRLLTLTGVGGVGKTRLAVEAAGQLHGAFADGTWLVDLATVSESGLVAQTVAAAMGIRDQSPRPAVDQLVAYLADRHALLVLDNCEHLLDACGPLVDRLLRTCRQLRVLATSRETLGIDGEHVAQVPPLSVPETGGEAEGLAPEELKRYEAVRLLMERATAVRPDFAITEHNSAAVGRLCAGLDGVPLAIELAATRLRSFSVEQLVDRLADRFGLLTSGSRAAQPRQRTLRALIDWSHDLCSAAERRLWARLSVFGGGFDLEAAEGVCADAELPREAVLDLLDRLVAQSIVVRTRADGPARFRLLDTIRQYGSERLADSGEQQLLRGRHRDHFVRAARAAGQDWCRPGQEAVLARLRADHANLRAAMDACLAEPAHVESALELCAALRWHWCANGFLSEGRRWLDQALEASTKPGRVRAQALWVAGWVSLVQGDHDVARRRLDEARRLAERTGDRAVAAHAASLLGSVAMFQGRTREAIGRFDEAVVALEETGNTDFVLLTLYQAIAALTHVGEPVRAAATAHRAIALSEQYGEHLGRAYAMGGLGFCMWVVGELDEARRLLLDSLRLQRGFRDALGVAIPIEHLAWVASSKAEFTVAARLLGTVDSVYRGVGTDITAFGPGPVKGHTHCVTVTRTALGRLAFRRAFDEGVQPTVEEAVEYAIQQSTRR